MYETVEFRHLKYFIAIAEEGNFTRAAERLYLAQPSLSTQIKQLEEDIGVVLFVRDFSGVRLTPSGEAFLPLARQLLRLKDRAIETVRAVHLGKTLPLQFGFSPFVNHTLAEAVLAIYDRLLPEREIQTTSYSTSHLLEMLSEGSLGAALLTLPVECKVLKVQKIASERILVCMRKDDPLANKPSVSKEAVGAKLRIFSDPKNHPAFYDHLLKQIFLAGILAEPSIFVSAPGDVQWMVKLKRGYALVRESVSLDEELTALPITDAELSVESGFVYNVANEQPTLQLLASELKELFKDFSPAKKRPNGRVRPKQASQMSLLG